MFSSNVSKLLKNTQFNNATKTPSSEWGNEEQQRKRLMTFVKTIQVSGKGIASGFAGTINEFGINVDTFDYDNLSFELTRICAKEQITMELDHELTELENHVKIAYIVNEPGRYSLDIRYLGIHIPRSPFKIQIQQRKNVAGAKDVVAFGKGLHQFVSGKINRFHLDLRKSGHGKISVMPSAGNNCHFAPLCAITEYKHGYQVQYIADATGPFFFHIKLNGKHIVGSPFLVKARTKEGVLEKTKMLFQMHFKNRKRLS